MMLIQAHYDPTKLTKKNKIKKELPHSAQFLSTASFWTQVYSNNTIVFNKYFHRTLLRFHQTRKCKEKILDEK
jgi:hypothetical protein